MAEIFESEKISGVLKVKLVAFGDPRGRFVETYRRSWFKNGREMVQGNRSQSAAGVLRGLHYHLKQSDFWQVPEGRVFVGLFDARPFSETFQKSESFILGGADRGELGIYIPPGVAHGFYAETTCTMSYLVDSYYDATDELGILWNDPILQIPWPNRLPILSDRDIKNPLFEQIDLKPIELLRGK